ncbi:tetratricopeptide repeat protein [Legionella spiritensis]|uniref:tetratricopeptide repeat protein n=1 Tax=Legionella spiritensis TaxID=452 RepID=UPI000F6DE044|nr:tetratricopeptide repeat protein [Legionella spiritensis]VEG89895.1 cytochrome c-type biogenesis protein [Legionella spiritensis]
MNEKWFLFCFAGMLVLAWAVIYLALRRSGKLPFVLIPLISALAVLGYLQWGAWFSWREFTRAEARQQQVKALLSSIKSPDELIQKLRRHLDDNPDSARGWYLLGRLYASRNEWQQAHDAYKKALQLKPDDELTTINYVQTLWQMNHRRLDEEGRTLIERVLRKNPDQPDALTFLAMNAYLGGHFQEAIDYWQKLLSMVPEQSEVALGLRKAIAKAQQQL